jgi:biotin operon repressor
MQTQLPFFPAETKLINASLGIREQDDFVYYLHNGNPIYCHGKADRNSYRFLPGNLTVNHLCSITELSEALGEGRKNIERYAKSFREKGADYFLARKETRGACHKVTPALPAEIQTELDSGLSNCRIAKEHNISESAIKCHIINGKLIKKK